MTATVLPYAFDEGLIQQAKTSVEPVAGIYPFGSKAVVAGRGSDLDQEIHLDRVQEDNLPLYRRRGGGCTVFLDPGNLIVSIAFPADGFGGIQGLFDKASDWLIQGFQTLGFSGIYQDGISDLVKDDRKIGGSCFYRAKGIAYYSASILVAPDLDGMDWYLAHPPREPVYRRGRSHKEFVSGLDLWFPGISIGKLCRALRMVLEPGSMKQVA